MEDKIENSNAEYNYERKELQSKFDAKTKEVEIEIETLQLNAKIKELGTANFNMRLTKRSWTAFDISRPGPRRLGRLRSRPFAARKERETRLKIRAAELGS